MRRRHCGHEATPGGQLHLDRLCYVLPRYVGPVAAARNDGELVNEWGMRRKAVGFNGGQYWVQTFYPLADTQMIDDLEAFEWPVAGWRDDREMPAAAREGRQTRITKLGTWLLRRTTSICEV